MADIFISYSRKDIAFARLLYNALNTCDLDTWIDWDRIPVGENWWNEVCEAIEKAHIFMFIISKTSIDSNVCRNEINEALKNNKRIIPIIVDDLSPEVINQFVPDLSSINWIIFERENHFQIEEKPGIQTDKAEDAELARPKDPQFQAALDKLNIAVHTDWKWVKFHTQLQMDAIRWRKSQYNKSYLLRGAALKEAEKLALSDDHQNPKLTELQREFIKSSKSNSIVRKRWLVGSLSAAIVIVLVLGILWLLQFNVSQFRKVLSQSNSLIKNDPGLALLLGIEASRVSDANPFISINNTNSIEALNNLYTAFESNSRLISYLTGNSSSVVGVAFREDGKVVASSNVDGSIYLWDISNPNAPAKIGKPFAASEETVPCIVFLAGGNILATGSVDGSITLYDISDASSIHSIGQTANKEQDAIHIMKINPNGNLLASGGEKGIVTLWDISDPASPKIIGDTLGNHEDQIWGMAFTPDGKNLAVSNWDHTIDIWNIENPKLPELVTTIILEGGFPFEIAINAKGNLLASGNSDGTISLWNIIDIEKPVLLQSIEAHSNVIQTLVFSPTNNLLASGSLDKTIRLWDVSDPAKITEIDEPLEGHTKQINYITFSPDGDQLASTSADTNLILWNVSNTVVSRFAESSLDGHFSFVKTLSFNHDASLLATGSVETNIWDFSNPSNPNLVTSLPDFDNYFLGAVTTFKFSPKGNILAAGFSTETGEDGYHLALWDLSDPQKPKRISQPLDGHKDRIWALSFSNDGKILVTGSWDRTVRIWDVSNPENPISLGQPLDGFTEAVYSTALSPDSKLLVIGCGDGTIYFYNISSPENIVQLGSPSDLAGIVSSLAFSPDGKTLASASKDLVQLWNTSNINKISKAGPPLSNPSLNGTTYASISSDGNTLAASGDEGAIVLWDISQPDSPITLGTPIPTHEGTTRSLLFSPQGKSLVSGNENRIGLVWNFSNERMIENICKMINRNLTKEEWREYFPLDPYHETCSNFLIAAPSNAPAFQIIEDKNTSENKGPIFGNTEDMINAFKNNDTLLESLVTENYTNEEMNTIGKILTFEIHLDDDQPLIWTPKWCASNESNLASNLTHIEFEEYLDGKLIDSDSFFPMDETLDDSTVCMVRYSVISDWPEGTSELISKIIIKEPINDGVSNYPAGTFTLKYLLTR